VVVEAFSLQTNPRCHRCEEKRIASELADADKKKAEAEKERTDFEDKNKAFDQQRSALLGKAADEAKAERERLIDEAKRMRKPCG